MYFHSVWRPISVMSISKSPQSTDVWLRSAFLSVLMLYCMLEIHLIHAICTDIYECILSHNCSAGFVICPTCTYDERFAA